MLSIDFDKLNWPHLIFTFGPTRPARSLQG
jgi:hypothetical protein